MLEQAPTLFPESVHSKVDRSIFTQSGRNTTSAFHFQLPFCCLTEPPPELWAGNYAPSHCLIGRDPGRKKQSIEPSCIPLRTLCACRWTASDNAINSTALKPFCPKTQAAIPTETNLAAQGKRSLEQRGTLEGKILQGGLLKCSHFTYQFTFHGIFHESTLAYCRTWEFSWGSDTSSELF